MKRKLLILMLVLLLTACSKGPSVPKYTNPFLIATTSLRVMVAEPEKYNGYPKENVVGPLIVESNDLTRKMLTIRPLKEDGQPDTDVEIEVSYKYAESSILVVDITKGDVIYAQGSMLKYSNSSRYYFFASAIRGPKQNVK